MMEVMLGDGDDMDGRGYKTVRGQRVNAYRLATINFQKLGSTF